MRAERVQVSWDSNKSKWVVRIEAGAEVIRRHMDVPKDADESAFALSQRRRKNDSSPGIPVKDFHGVQPQDAPPAFSCQ
jgi:hypothetical protein